MEGKMNYTQLHKQEHNIVYAQYTCKWYYKERIHKTCPMIEL